MRMMAIESEADVRSCFCAASVSFYLRRVTKSSDYGFDREKLGNYIVGKCLGYQGGFTYAGNPEAHSGLTYCALGTLCLIDWKLSKHEFNRCIEFAVFQ